MAPSSQTQSQTADHLPGQPLSLYVHVPFCLSKCPYCDFNTYQGMEHAMAPYVEAAMEEARLWGERLGNPPATTVFFGGGTPSYLKAEQLGRLLSSLLAAFPLVEGAEVTAEANPGDLDDAKLDAMLRMRINRLSIGVQSTDDALLEMLGRRHTALEAASAYGRARGAGFRNVSLDLMFGLPHQSMEQWQASVQNVVELAPEHLSLYGLTLETGTAMEQQVRRGILPEPDPDLAADMYEYAREAMTNAGYEHYEISNWCLPGYRSRHNMAYWQVDPYLGIGPGAHSNLDGFRFHNVKLPSQYARSVQRWAEMPHEAAVIDEFVLKDTPTLEGLEATGPETAMAETLFLGLRLLDGIQLREFQLRHGTGLIDAYGAEVGDLVSSGLLELSGECLKLTSKGLLLSNQVFVRFVN
jgi:oxygen-independent coproporphyrinogen-3 oxidase